MSQTPTQTDERPKSKRRNMTLPAVTLTGPEISDLFFNRENPSFKNHCLGILGGSRMSALERDAEAFLDSLPSLREAGITPDDLVRDFLRRL